MPIDEREAFWAMFCFLNHQAERTERPETVHSVLTALRAELFDHGEPADRPLWDEWLASVEAVRGSASPDTADGAPA